MVVVRPISLLLSMVLTFMLFSCQDEQERAEECIKLKDYTRAIRLYEPLLDQQPHNAKLRFGHALAFYSLAKVAKDSSSCDLWEQADQSLMILSMLDSSLQVKQMWADAEAGLADCAVDKAQIKDALDLIELSLKIDSLNLKAWDLRAFVYESLENWPKATESYQKLIEIDSQNMDNYEALIRLELLQGDTLSAMNLIDRGLRVNPNSDELNEYMLLLASLKSR